MRKDLLWPAATCIAVALAVSAAISLRGKHGERRSGGKLEELREGLRQEAASETGAAQDCSSRVLKMVPDYDQAIFNYYDRLAPTVAEVLPHLTGDRRGAGLEDYGGGRGGHGWRGSSGFRRAHV